MDIKYETKDLLTVDRTQYVIAHCISADCGMGAGVVIPICKMHPELKSQCKEYSNSFNQKVVGKVFKFTDSIGIVYNLFSKQRVFHKAGVNIAAYQYHDQLRECLVSLKDQMILAGEKFLAMPQIACGLDRCNWTDVSKIIEEVFEGTDIEILICIWG